MEKDQDDCGPAASPNKQCSHTDNDEHCSNATSAPRPSDQSRKQQHQLWRILVAVATAIAVIVAVIAAIWVMTNRAKVPASVPTTSSIPTAPTSSTPTPSTSSPTTTAPTASNTPNPIEVAAGAKSLQELPQDPPAHIAPGVGDHFQVDLAKAFPPGTKIEVDKSTWTQIDTDQAMVITTITRPGQAPKKFNAMLVKVSGQWKLVGTFDVE